MYNLVSRITDGLGELKKLLETHIYNQGLAAIEKCGEAALNVSHALPYCTLPYPAQTNPTQAKDRHWLMSQPCKRTDMVSSGKGGEI